MEHSCQRDIPFTGIARDHNNTFGNQHLIITSPQGRFSREAKRLNGARLIDVEAHGKHLFYHLASPGVKTARRVHVHLGLYGKFRLHKNPAPEPRGAVRVRMIGENKAFDLNGPTKCEIISNVDYRRLKQRLGVDPLDPEADPTIASEKIRRSRGAIGSLLLNQSLIAGIGNVYRAELLFKLGIHPSRPGNSLSVEDFDSLWNQTVDWFHIGVKYNRIITVDRIEGGKPLSRLNREERLRCYKKDRCGQCQKPISRFTLGARTMYACNRCQS